METKYMDFFESRIQEYYADCRIRYGIDGYFVRVMYDQPEDRLFVSWIEIPDGKTEERQFCIIQDVSAYTLDQLWEMWLTGEEATK